MVEEDPAWKKRCEGFYLIFLARGVKGGSWDGGGGWDEGWGLFWP